MRKELLIPIFSVATLCFLSTSTSKGRKRKAYERTNGMCSRNPKERAAEIHHKKRVRDGGRNTLDNLEPVSRPTHAEIHLKAGLNAYDPRTRTAELWAARQIKQRMTPQEREIFHSKPGNRVNIDSLLATSRSNGRKKKTTRGKRGRRRSFRNNRGR